MSSNCFWVKETIDLFEAADPNFKQAHYLEVYFSGNATVPQELKEKLHLDKRVNRIFVESNN